jgi:hypothetical protein
MICLYFEKIREKMKLYLKKYLTEKNRRITLFICSLSCLLICVDTFLIPQKATTEYVEEIIVKYNRARRGSYNSYTLVTNKRNRNITKVVYTSLRIKDSVKIYHSILTGSFQKVGVLINGAEINTNSGFLYDVGGYIFFGLTLIFLVVYFALHKTNFNWDRNAVTSAVLVNAIILIIQHLKN